MCQARFRTLTNAFTRSFVNQVVFEDGDITINFQLRHVGSVRSDLSVIINPSCPGCNVTSNCLLAILVHRGLLYSRLLCELSRDIADTD